MNKNIRLVISIITGACIILLCMTTAFFIMKEGEKAARIALQKIHDETILEKQNLEEKLKAAEISNAELKAGIKAQDDKIAMLSQNLREEKAASDRNFATTQLKDSEIQRLKSRIDEEVEEKESLLKRIEKMNEDYLNIKFQLESLIRSKEEMDKRARELTEKEGVSLGTIVIKRAPK